MSGVCGKCVQTERQRLRSDVVKSTGIGSGWLCSCDRHAEPFLRSSSFSFRPLRQCCVSRQATSSRSSLYPLLKVLLPSIISVSRSRPLYPFCSVYVAARCVYALYSSILALSIASHPPITEYLTYSQLFGDPVPKGTIILCNFIWPSYSFNTPWEWGLKPVLKPACFAEATSRKNPGEELELALRPGEGLAGPVPSIGGASHGAGAVEVVVGG
jgi:hypothetical protein